jgi:pyruvate dehydrogenase E1 component alpha subunit
MYKQMLRIRLFEEQVNQLYTRALMPGLAHLYIGEEAVAVGVCEALRPNDYITSTHRGHGHCLAKGAALDRMFAELLGKEAGYCKGKGGSMHIADPDTGNLGANAIVCGSAGIATGAAFSAKRLGTGKLPSASLVMALWVRAALRSDEYGIVVEAACDLRCENNLYNEYTHMSETTAGNIELRGPAFGVESHKVDGQDVRAVHAITQKLVEKARKGMGLPFFSAIPIASTVTTSATSRANTTVRNRKSSPGKIEIPCHRWRSGSLPKVLSTAPHSIRSRTKFRSKSIKPLSSRSTLPIPLLMR